MPESAETALIVPPDPAGTPEAAELSPAQRQLRQMVLDSVSSPDSRRSYAKALDLLFGFAGGRPLTRALLMEFRASMDDLAPSTVNVRLSAVRKLVTEAKRNGWLSTDEAAARPTSPTSGRREPVSETGSPRSRAGSCWPCPIARL